MVSGTRSDYGSTRALSLGLTGHVALAPTLEGTGGGAVAGIVRKSLERPETEMEFKHGRAVAVRIGDDMVWRSELTAGWNWDEDLEPWAGGATSCPLTHREYVVQGRIRYLMTDGTEEHAVPGTTCSSSRGIGPGWRATRPACWSTGSAGDRALHRRVSAAAGGRR